MYKPLNIVSKPQTVMGDYLLPTDNRHMLQDKVALKSVLQVG